MTDLYTVELTLTNGRVATGTGVSAADARGCVTAFLDQTGREPGVCGFFNSDGIYSWPWDDISSCKVTRQP